MCKRKNHYVDRIPHSEDEHIAELYQSGMSIIQIAAKYKCSLSLIGDRLDSVGIQKRQSDCINIGFSLVPDDCDPPGSCFNCKYPDCRMQNSPRTLKEKSYIKGAMK